MLLRCHYQDSNAIQMLFWRDVMEEEGRDDGIFKHKIREERLHFPYQDGSRQA